MNRSTSHKNKRKYSLGGPCRNYSVDCQTSPKKGKTLKQRNTSAFDQKIKTQIKAEKQNLSIERHETDFMHYSHDLNNDRVRNRITSSLNLDSQRKDGNVNYNCMTISPWLKQRDHPIVKREKNLFQYYMNEIKRKREERAISKKIKNQQYSGGPLIIKSVEDKCKQISSVELAKVQEMYRNWKNSHRMLVSGRSIKMNRSKNQTSNEKVDGKLTKKKKGLTQFQKKFKEESEIKAWDSDHRIEKDENSQF